MATFEVTFTNGKTETIEADSYLDRKTWLVSQKQTGELELNEEILRLKASTVNRVQRL
jgi:hypothetical protein